MHAAARVFPANRQVFAQPEPSTVELGLYDRLAAVDGLVVVPQWPARGKSIDLVVTDAEGRRLAVEADGDQHHETNDGELIPEDIERQGLLEEAGWVFHRIRHSAFKEDADHEIGSLLAHLASQPPNPDLAARIRGDAVLEEVVRASDEPALASATPVAPITADGAAAGAARAQATAQPDPPEVVDAGGDGAAALDANEEEDGPPLRTDLHQMTGEQTEGFLDEIFEDAGGRSGGTATTEDAGDEKQEQQTVADRKRGAGESAAALGSEITTFAEVPLRRLALCVSAVVEERGELAEDDLVDAFSGYYAIEVPQKFHSLLNKFAWSAKGHHFIRRNDVTATWAPGEKEAHEIDPFGDWTFNGLVARTAELLPTAPEPTVFEQLLHEVYPTPSGRVPRIVTTIVGKAIYAVKHS
ncbi:MAG: hypothetical protein ACRDLA_17810 [Thermoleophilaceae bacterium]